MMDRDEQGVGGTALNGAAACRVSSEGLVGFIEVSI